jgi:sulfur transfer protein SufE
MEELIEYLVERAQEEHPGKEITPCSNKTWTECYQPDNGLFWFNTDKNTHIIKL